MEFVSSARNSRKLHYNGYLYVKNKTFNDGRTYWECEERRSGNGCRVKIILDEGDNLERMVGDHTHAPNPERFQALGIRAEMRREARLIPDRSTNNIVAGNIAFAPEGVMANLPQLETIRRDIRRNRQHVRNAPPIPDRHDFM